jgi:hypothetical protein
MDYNNFIPIHLWRDGNRFQPTYARRLCDSVFLGHGKHTSIGLDQWAEFRSCRAGLGWFGAAPFCLYQKRQSHLMLDGSDKGKALSDRCRQCEPFTAIQQGKKFFVLCLYALQVCDIAWFTVSGLGTTSVHDMFVGDHCGLLWWQCCGT